MIQDVWKTSRYGKHYLTQYHRENTLQKRFEGKYIPVTESGCWLWIGSLTKKNYGMMKSINGRNESAHRISWKLFNGEIPQFQQVLHKCDVPCCVNPKHLYLGSNADNMKDRNTRGHKVFGEKSGRAKISEIQAIQIKADKRRTREIAFEYGISKCQVNEIKNGSSWKHLSN